MLSAPKRRVLYPSFLVLVVAATALLSSACLWGVVRDADTGEGLSGVTITFTDKNGNSATTTSGGGGLYAFNAAAGQPIPAVGQTTFELSKEGYNNRTTVRNVQYNDNPHAFWEVQSFEMGIASGDIDTLASGLGFPVGAVYDLDGTLYFTERNNCRVQKIDAGTGLVSTVAGNGTCGYAGDGGPALSAQLSNPSGLAIDPSGDLVVTDTGNCRIRKIDMSSGNIWTVAGNGTCGFGGDGGPATSANLRLSDAVVPSIFVWSDVTIDAVGNMYIADIFNCRVRLVNTLGTIITIAGSGATGFACGAYAGDGGAPIAARLYHPTAVAVDASDNLYIADSGNCRIRMITPGRAPVINTVAGDGTCSFAGDGGMAVDASVRNPRSLAVDGNGDLFFSEFSFAGSPLTEVDCRVRRVDGGTGRIYTLAGTGTCGFSGDGGPAVNAQVNTPGDIALSCNGDVAFTEALNGRVRVVDNSSSGGPAPGYLCD